MEFKRECGTIRQAEEKRKLLANIAVDVGIVLLFDPGFRIGELCALKWGDIETGEAGNYNHLQRELISNVN